MVTIICLFSNIRKQHIFNFWAVSLNEVEALYDLFKKLSSSIVDDGLIHKVSAS